MKIAEFIEGREVDPQAVRKYISRHPEFEGHITREENEIILDSAAVEMLEKKYPVPNYLEKVEKEVQMQIISIQNSMLEQSKELAKLEAIKAKAEMMETMLHDREEQIKETKARNERLEQKVDDKEAEIKEKEKEIQKLREQLEAERNSYTKSIFGLFRKKGKE